MKSNNQNLIGIAVSMLLCYNAYKEENDVKTKTNCSISASILSLGISAAVALLVNFGYMCVQIVFLGMIQDNVLRFIIGVLLSAVGLVISVILMCQYIQLRKKEPKWVGILIDILTVFITFPLFSYIFSSLV